MKKKFSILFIALASLIVLVSGIIPHHHHNNEGVAFITMEHCGHECASDNEQTNHDANTKHSNQTCVANSFYNSNTESRVKIKVASCDGCQNPYHTHLFSILYVIAEFLTHPAENNFSKSEYGEHILLYTSAEASQFHGLRAPPFTLS